MYWQRKADEVTKIIEEEDTWILAGMRNYEKAMDENACPLKY